MLFWGKQLQQLLLPTNSYIQNNLASQVHTTNIPHTDRINCKSTIQTLHLINYSVAVKQRVEKLEIFNNLIFVNAHNH